MIRGRQQYWADAQYDAPYPDHDDLALNVEPSERIGPPLPSPYRAIFRRVALGTAVIAGAWAIAVDEPGSVSWLTPVRSFFDIAVSNALRLAERPADDVVPQDQPGTSGENVAQGPSAEQSGAVELPPVEMQTPAQEEAAAESGPPAPEAIGAAYSEKAEVAEDAPDRSPKHKSAVEAGLGPDLPNVLLSRLSKGDIENAAYAIKTAVAKTPDDGVFVWPPAPSRKQALFEVRFVDGAAEGCRRYVVTVTKRRWSSTTAALERCESAGPRAG